MLRRLRGVLGTALIWALAWLPLGFLVPLLRGAPPECLYCPTAWFIRFLVTWVGWGAVSGVLFAVVLMRAERSRSLGELSLPRTATWGAVGTIGLPLFLTIVDVIQVNYSTREWQFALVALTVAAGMGALCGAATLAMSRRGLTRT